MSTKAALGSLLPTSLRLFRVALSGAVVLQTHTHHSSIGHARLETQLVRQPEHNQSAISGALVCRSCIFILRETDRAAEDVG